MVPEPEPTAAPAPAASPQPPHEQQLTPEQEARRAERKRRLEERLAAFRAARKAGVPAPAEAPAPPAPEPLIPAELEQRLASPYPVDREEGVRELSPIDSELDRLMSLLASDSAPEVRAAAAEQMAGAVSYAAVGSLLAALRDPDPRVIKSALGSLEIGGDSSIVTQIMPLLDHPDAEVREAAGQAIETLQ